MQAPKWEVEPQTESWGVVTGAPDKVNIHSIMHVSRLCIKSYNDITSTVQNRYRFTTCYGVKICAYNASVKSKDKTSQVNLLLDYE